jgi:hypothetical protein
VDTSVGIVYFEQMDGAHGTVAPTTALNVITSHASRASIFRIACVSRITDVIAVRRTLDDLLLQEDAH